VMCAYNRTNDEACCANTYLLQDVLRNQWGFKGHIVTDCDALEDIYKGHQLAPDKVHAAALALQRGVNLNCGDTYFALIDAVKQGLVTEKQIDSSLAVLLRTRFKLGMFDPSADNPYNQIPVSVINSPEHRELARTVAQKSLVLLKNDGALPLRNDLKKYFVTGPNASSVDVLLGNYYGVNGQLVTILEGLASHIKPGSQMGYKQGILLDRGNISPIDWTTGEAKSSDATIVVMGISGLLEGEEGESIASPTAGDRLDYNIPQNQVDFLRKIKEGNPHPVIAVITGGSPMNLAEVQKLADAVLLVWYPGEEGGNAVADVLFGKVSPSGKLPVTFPQSLDQLPAFTDYAMKGRTYRYMDAEPLYPFGFGLSYTTFAYSRLKVSGGALHADASSASGTVPHARGAQASGTVLRVGQSLAVEATVTNTGRYKSDEVVQLYLTHKGSSLVVPLFSLKGFHRISLAPGQSKVVHFTLTPQQLSLVNEEGLNVQPSDTITISVGDAVPTPRSLALGASLPVQTTISVQ